MKWKLTKFVNPFLIVVLSLILITGCGTDTSDYSINSSEESGEISVEAEVSVDERTGTAGDESSKEGQTLFSQLKGKNFIFSSGHGGWMTNIEMQENGNFKGSYMDSDLGMTGSDYPNGTYYECEFVGRFVFKERMDEYTYSVSLQNVETSSKIGTESIRDGVKHIVADPYGFDTGEAFKIYAKGHPVATLPEDFIEWVSVSPDFSENDTTLPFWGLFNEKPDDEWGYGMFEDQSAELSDSSSNSSKVNESVETSESQTQQSAASEAGETYSPFYGIWCAGRDTEAEAKSFIQSSGLSAYNPQVILSSQWSNLGNSKSYVVTAGTYSSKKEAESQLSAVQQIVPDAYVKYSGKWLGNNSSKSESKESSQRINFSLGSSDQIEVHENNVILKDVNVYSDNEEPSYVADLIVDKNTVFDPSCEMEYFGNYNDGDTVLQWYKNNSKLESGMSSLRGSFKVQVTGSHIDRYYGAYWWD